LAGAGSDLAGADSDLAGAGSDLACAPASPILAMGAPILAGTPCSTRICRTPSDSASRSNVALSDSTSASTSPAFTWSPLFFFDHHAAARLAHGVDDRRPVDGADRAQVDDLGIDVLFLELLCSLVGQHGHPRDTDDRHVGAGAAEGCLAERRRVVAWGNVALH